MNNKTKFLSIVIVALLLMNAGTLAFMFMRGGHGGGPREVSKWLAHELKFDAAQEQKLETLQDEHRQNMEPIHKEDRALHDRYFSLLHGESVDSAQVKQIADSIALNRIQTELVTFYDFRKIRAICNPEQQKKFDEIIGQALRMMGQHGPPSPGKD